MFIIAVIIYIASFLAYLYLSKANKSMIEDITYPRAFVDSGTKVVGIIASAFFMFFTIIDLIIDPYDGMLSLSSSIIWSSILWLEFLVSRTGIVVTKREVIKYEFYGKKIIRRSDVISIDYGYTIVIKSEKATIRVCRKYYSTGLKTIISELHNIRTELNP